MWMPRPIGPHMGPVLRGVCGTYNKKESLAALFLLSVLLTRC